MQSTVSFPWKDIPYIYLFVLQHTKEVRQIEAQPDVYSSAVRKRIVPNLLSTFGYVLHSLMFAL